MTLGPLEYTVIGFEGNNFDGSIADELSRVIDSGVISVVDLVFVGKGEDGHLAHRRARQQGGPALRRRSPRCSRA